MKTPFRLIIRFLMTGLLTGLTCSFSNGQSINELRKLWQDNKTGYLGDQQKDKLYSDGDFSQYARIRDEEFCEYLKEPWHDFAISAGLSEESRSNLSKEPVFNYEGRDMTPPVNLPFSVATDFNKSGTGLEKLMPRIRKTESEVITIVKEAFQFYGQPISLSYDKLLETIKATSASEDAVSVFWCSFARANSNQLVGQLMDYRDLLGLGDWGYFQLVKATSGHIFKEDRLSSDMLTWALMIRSGFDVRIALNQDSATVLFPCESTIYSRPFVVIGQKRFYLDREMKSQFLVSCQNPFPDNEGRINLRFFKSLNFNGKLIARKFLYVWNNKNLEFTLRFNPEVIRFYRNYPQTEASIYFGAPMSSTLKEDLFAQIYPVLSKVGKAEATAFLQQFVQREIYYTSVNQKDVWANGRFAEEIVASKTGNDRGKAVLFSWLIRVLLQLPVVGVHFPNYYSTAISFDEPFEGDFYYCNRERYCLTDPTFLNAPIGVMMPEFAGLTPQLIDFSGAEELSARAEATWKQALKLGALRGGTGQDVVYDRLGRALITGYFNDKRSYNPFVACFSPENTLQWIRKFEGGGRAIAFAITKVNEDEIYIAGAFKGRIVMDGAVLLNETGKGDLFLAQLNQNGELVWLKSAGIDPSSKNESLAFLVKFDRSGDDISRQWSNEDGRNIRTGFGDIRETGLDFTGSKATTPGLVPFSWTTAKYDISGGIFNECTLLKGRGCRPEVAGVAALLRLLQKPGAEITGNQLQTLILHSKSSFSVDYPSLFKTIGQIGMLKNENGIISLRTIDGKSLIFNELIVSNGTRLTVSVFDNGDLSVGIISGFQKVVNQMMLSLNKLLIDCSSGNVILDYDHDHTMKTVSVETLFGGSK